MDWMVKQKQVLVGVGLMFKSCQATYQWLLMYLNWLTIFISTTLEHHQSKSSFWQVHLVTLVSLKLKDKTFKDHENAIATPMDFKLETLNPLPLPPFWLKG